MMLSLGKLAPGQQQYYLDTVARGAEEYYVDGKEAPGEWVGAAAARLGLRGEVGGDTLHDVLRGRDPRTGLPLTRAQGAPSVPGFDATFCAPKSVSLLYALGDPETSNEVRNAHDAAVARSLEALEGVAAQARRGKGGAEQVVADGFVGAAFRHRTSRSGDPHLHTHVVIANLVHAPSDGRWSALDARPLYSWAKTAGYLYEAQLRQELTRRLGVAWTTVRHGIADVAGFPDSALRAFSTRRQQIEEHLERVGEDTARAAQVAAYATRTAKDETAASVTEWRQRAHAHGLDAHVLAATLGRGRLQAPPEHGTEAVDVLFAQLASPTGLTEHHSTFGRREVLQAIAEALPTGGDIAVITELADAFLASTHVVELRQARGLRSSDVIRRRDGTVVATHTDAPRWTTQELLAVEMRVVTEATGRRRARVGIVASAAVKDAIAARPSLSREQTRLVQHVTGSGAGVDVVEGAAGTGKTYALAAAREAWEASGHRVIGCALAARAAEQLENGADIASSTIHRLLRSLDDPRRPDLTSRDVVVVDEAAMVGTRTLARVLDHAAAGAKVVLVGDPRQLPAIDAGGTFAGLARRLGAIRLHDNRRQQAEWERRALDRLRNGATDRALDAYQAQGRIHVLADADSARARLVDDWLRERRQGGTQVMLAARTRDVDELNHLAREGLRAAGHLGSDRIMVAGRSFALRDQVLATRNDYDLGILNGTCATITAIDQQRGTIAARTESGAPIVIPPSYLRDGHLTHAYATTLYKAQGSTVRDAFVLADHDLDRERGYTALSRGANSNHLYLNDEPTRTDERHAPEVEPTALERLAAELDVSHADELALDLDDELVLGL